MLPANSLPFGALSVRVESRDEIIQQVIQAARLTGRTHLLVPLNAQLFVLTRRCAKLAEMLRRAEWIVSDGMSIIFALRVLWGRRIERVNGTETMELICREAARAGLSVLLLGGRLGSAEAACQSLRESCPSLRAAAYCPPFGFEGSSVEIQKLRAFIQSERPNIAFIALGVPKQEFLMDSVIRDIGVPVAMAVGGSFEMIAGLVPRAPVWMRRSGLEWVFRLVIEPRRLFWRYATTNPVFVGSVLKELWMRGFRRMTRDCA